MIPQIIVLGRHSLSGVYLLCIRLHQSQRLAFGRFRNGMLFDLEAGNYLYLGSARHHTLAARLLRHTRRTGIKPAQEIQAALVSALQEEGIPVSNKPAAAKKLHWHIDYLLDNLQAELQGILALRTEQTLEASLGQWLLAQAETGVIAEDLGASDVQGNTHLLYIFGQGWEPICLRLVRDFIQAEIKQ